MLLNATLSALGALSVGLDGAPWLESGAVAIRNHATWFSSTCPHNTQQAGARPCTFLFPQQEAPRTGTDELGPYTEHQVAWAYRELGPPPAPVFVTGVRSYAAHPDIAVLTQSFPIGLQPKNTHGNTGEIVSAFPTWGVSSSQLDLGVLLYEGVQCQNSRFFKWLSGAAFGAGDPGQSGSKRPDPDGSGMPLILTSAGGSTLVASPLEDFFTSAQTTSVYMNGSFSFGLQGTLSSVPPGHVHRTLLVAGSGVRAATMKWGELLLKAAGGGKRRSMAWTLQGDVSLRSLSYYTE
jgi:hypothetical protein|eukprot:SAG25_NODE_890_length_4910_cov_1.895448_3_plen_293_part_00